VFDADRQFAVVPVLTDSTQRRNQHLLDQVRYRRLLRDDRLPKISSAMKRVTIEHPEWTMEFMDGLQREVAAIDHASTQWTLVLLFDLTRALQTAAQHERSLDIMKCNLVGHDDWIVLNNSMQGSHEWSIDDPALADWLTPHL
jgi:hypothetical protein